MMEQKMSKKLALVTGSFDPITIGHLDIVSRAAKIFDSVIVVVAHNEEKQYMFTPAQRVEIVREAIKDYENVSVELCDGYVADFAKNHAADAFVRGIRGDADVAYEQNMANINFANSGVDTWFLFANPMYHDISSTRVREALKNKHALDTLMETQSAKKALEFLGE
ncbi:MAG: pantetheine-phosphate adenylyltransferase [Ruminococcaceae bacterium]|nr:pantetheine-phosphate adenylyltransferase [Oscillospiraceae bacterium]